MKLALNGERQFHGVSLHHDHGALGEENYKAEYRRPPEMGLTPSVQLITL